MVDFLLTEDQRALQSAIRGFAQHEIRPYAMQYDQMADHAKSFSNDIIQKCLDMGLHTVTIPKSYGGQGLDCLTTAVIWEELGAADCGVALTMHANFLAVESIFSLGTPKQREVLVRPMTEKNGAGIGALAGTEPNHSTCDPITIPDTYRYDTKLVQDGDYYILNGQKCWCTNGGTPFTKWYVIFAQLEDVPGNAGVRICLVKADAEGLSSPGCEDKMGHRLSRSGQLSLENVRVHKDFVNKYPNFAQMYKGGDHDERITVNSMTVIGAMFTGMARSAYEEALEYSKVRMSGGVPLHNHQLVSAKLADMYWQIEMMRAYVWRVASHFDTAASSDQVNFKLAMGVKVKCSDMLKKVVDDALQIHGAYGYSKGYLVEKLYRDARVTQIYEGSNEVLSFSTGEALAVGR